MDINRVLGTSFGMKRKSKKLKVKGNNDLKDVIPQNFGSEVYQNQQLKNGHAL